MSRKKFMESIGATSRNSRYGWGFVNHKEKFVVFGAWDVDTVGDRSTILKMDWERNAKGRKQNAFGEAMEYIKLVEQEGYTLKTFPIIQDTEYKDELGTGRAKIKDYVEEISDMTLEIVNGDYIAVGAHKSEYATKTAPNVAQDIKDIFYSEVESTEKESLIMSRIGQGKFRKNVIDIWGNGECCALTLVNVREMLVASHIVPWSVCNSNEQRLDGSNGILLCAHIDKLFDSHLLTFFKRGNKYMTKLSPSIDQSMLKALGIEQGLDLCSGQMDPLFRARFEDYLQIHNENFENKTLKAKEDTHF
jgi:hypothetical protein